MKEVLATIDRSLFESARGALAAEDIATLVANDNASLPFTPTTLSVVHDGDFERAVAIIHELEPASSRGGPSLSRARRYFWVVFVVVLMAVLGLCGLIF